MACLQHDLVTHTNDLIIRDIYILSSNDDTKFADWVAYKITADTISSTKTRTWRADPYLDDNETLEPDDYKDAHATIHTDRGHQAPLASFTGTEHWRDTNYLSNITPQKSDLNQGPWVHLESAIRDLIREHNYSAVYVMTGALYERDMAPLPQADESHKVPSGYWKIISRKKGRFIKVAPFIFDQRLSKDADYCEQLVTVDEIERKSGLTFFHGLPDNSNLGIEESPRSLINDLGCELI